MERLRTEMPDEVYLAPSCHLWSQMQNLAARTEAQQDDLYHKRKKHHACHLVFVSKIYMEQVNNARHAHIEQPERALSWHTTALKDSHGYWIVFHQCMFAVPALTRMALGNLPRSQLASSPPKFPCRQRCLDNVMGNTSTVPWKARHLDLADALPT